MAEKGGKGHSLPGKAAKSSLKSTTPNGGLGDGIFGFSSGSKADSLLNKLNLGKGGKGDKTGRAAKSSAPKEQPPLELRVEQELPKHAKCLMDCEAAEILQGIQEQMVVLSEDPTIKIPVMYQALLASGDLKSARIVLSKMPKDDPHVRLIIQESQTVYAKMASEKKTEKNRKTKGIKHKKSKAKNVASSSSNALVTNFHGIPPFI
ncbi:hypothetical protein ACJRO7_025671 [Eucalyptus globulus]|uniref:Uncharacterized protein n=1 Tax=Eucalyptus globulus TaxID=34317 RepID=A0ABD3KBQ1_EUCGL